MTPKERGQAGAKNNALLRRKTIAIIPGQRDARLRLTPESGRGTDGEDQRAARGRIRTQGRRMRFGPKTKGGVHEAGHDCRVEGPLNNPGPTGCIGVRKYLPGTALVFMTRAGYNVFVQAMGLLVPAHSFQPGRGQAYPAGLFAGIPWAGPRAARARGALEGIDSVMASEVS